MKKLIICGFLIGTVLGAHAMPKSGDMLLATGVTAALGGTFLALGKLGIDNVAGTAIAATTAYAGHFITQQMFEQLVAAQVITTAPAIAPIVVATALGGLMLWIRKSYLPGTSINLAQFGKVLLTISGALGILAGTEHILNQAGLTLSVINTLPNPPTQ